MGSVGLTIPELPYVQSHRREVEEDAVQGNRERQPYKVVAKLDSDIASAKFSAGTVQFRVFDLRDERHPDAGTTPRPGRIDW